MQESTATSTKVTREKVFKALIAYETEVNAARGRLSLAVKQRAEFWESINPHLGELELPERAIVKFAAKWWEIAFDEEDYNIPDIMEIGDFTEVVVLGSDHEPK